MASRKLNAPVNLLAFFALLKKVADEARLYGWDVQLTFLRHSWATWAANDGMSMFDIAGVLGDTVATVTKHYAKHAPENLKRAVQLTGIGPQAKEKAA